ncbi:hypothetical protein [Nitrospirillum sp. BR 11828]|uniref:hypothetical protein n=1 Tax=Nitrospirillum sp. BR 11828 TaxID=3104325 RepID=UPI002ACA692B|nr:hypothetical protein [Nitrospirillum sp. BR 11828]MDZ5650383.1 hypothetical protein [Nitrospirillum sp. BR 11828]
MIARSTRFPRHPATRRAMTLAAVMLGAVILGAGTVAAVGGMSRGAWAQGVPLAVTAQGDLPGFQPQEVAPFLVMVMSTAGQNTPGGGQTFFAAGFAAADRVEWTFRPNPYAGGASRSIGPPRPTADRLFGRHRLMSVELRLYRGGRYQTQVFGQVEIQGGRRDADLQTFICDMTRRVLDAAAQ